MCADDMLPNDINATYILSPPCPTVNAFLVTTTVQDLTEVA